MKILNILTLIYYMWCMIYYVKIPRKYELKLDYSNTMTSLCVQTLNRPKIIKYFYRKNGKPDKYSFTIQCDFNSIGYLLLMMCGDIESNPGPYRCINCSNDIDDSAEISIQCNMCNEWSHKICSGLNDTEFKTFKKPHLYWICTKCSPNIAAGNYLKIMNQKMDDLIVSSKKLENTLTNHDIRISSLEKHNELLIEKITLVENQNEKLRNDFADSYKHNLGEKYGDQKNMQKESIDTKHDKFVDCPSINKVVFSCIDEYEKNKDREKNVIMFGIRESEKSDDYRSESAYIESYINEFINDLRADIDIHDVKFYRIGKKRENYCRPIKLAFCDKKKKGLFYDLYKKIKFGPEKYRNISISNDRSIEQRTEFKKKREIEKAERNRLLMTDTLIKTKEKDEIIQGSLVPPEKKSDCDSSKGSISTEARHALNNIDANDNMPNTSTNELFIDAKKKDE